MWWSSYFTSGGGSPRWCITSCTQLLAVLADYVMARHQYMHKYQATPPVEYSLEDKVQHYLPMVGCPVPQEDGVSTSAYTTPWSTSSHTK